MGYESWTIPEASEGGSIACSASGLLGLLHSGMETDS